MRRSILAVAAIFAFAAVTTASSLAAQTAPVVADLMKDIDGAGKKLVALAKATPDDKMSWRPGPGVRSTSEVFLHIASDNYFIPNAFGYPIPESTGIKSGDFKSLQAFETRKLTSAEIAAEVEKSFAFLKEHMAKTTAADLAKPVQLFGMNGTAQSMWILAATHLHEHLGQSIAYARTNGIVPPWSRK